MLALAFALGFIIVTVLLIRSCDSGKDPSERAALDEPAELNPLRDGKLAYLQLARYVLRRADVPGETRVNMSEAEYRGWAEEARDVVSQVETDDEELIALARSFRGVLTMFEEARGELPSQSDAIEGGLGLLLGLSSEDEDARGEAFLGALGGTMRMNALVKRLEQIHADHEAARVRLLLRAPIYNGPADGSVSVPGAFTERRHSLDGPDTLVLTNVGQELRDCTVAIRLSNARGESRTHGYFVPRWSERAQMRFQFESGNDGGFRRTVRNITTVEYAIFSPKGSMDKITLLRPSGGWARSGRSGDPGA